MTRISTLVILTLFLSACLDSKETTASATKNVIKFGKEVIGGISEGVDEGRKEAEGVDGAVIVTNIDELEKNVTVKILMVKSIDNNQRTNVEISLKNASEKPIRIANLDDKGTVLLLDTDGYAQELNSSSRYQSEITIPPNAGKKHNFTFNIPASKAKTLRLWNKDYAIKNIPIISESHIQKDSDSI